MKSTVILFLSLFALTSCSDSNSEKNDNETVSIGTSTSSNSAFGDSASTEKNFLYKVNLKEVPGNAEDLIKSNFKIESVDINQNTVSVKESVFGGYIYRFIHTGILNNNIKQFEFYNEESYLKLSYWEYIINQLPEFVDYGYKYDSYSDDFSEEGKLFAMLAYRIDRSPENINNLFNTYKDLIFSEIDGHQYRQRRLKTYVEYLITTYDYIVSLEDYQMKLNDISEAVALADADENIFIRADQGHLYESIYSPWKVNNHHDALWFYSFWLRRYQEGNFAAVYSILQKIDAHYYSTENLEEMGLEDDGTIYTGAGHWKKINNCEVPENAVVGGYESGRNLIVCRAEYADGIHPGKLVDCSCNIGYGDLEIVSNKFEVLVSEKDYRWEQVINCDLPAGAIRGGIEGERYLVICRANYEGGMHPGKVVDCNCNIGYAGKEIHISDYEVLVKSTSN